MAAYVDHGLSLAERARVEAHLASCPQCVSLLAGVVRTVADVSAFIPDAGRGAEATPLLTRRMVLGALAAAAAVIAVLILPSLVRPWLERDAGLVSLVDSVGEHRPVLGRLTGGFPHAPLRVSSAGGQDGQAPGPERVLLTAGKIRESFGELQRPSRLHALGLAQLLAGQHDEAAQSLLAASREQPGNARYLNDVAAVQLERARLGLRPDDLPRALAAADRARRLDPSLSEAWFNRALALSALSLTDQAKAAWAEYLRRDSVSPWAAEARARLADLSTPTPAAAWQQIEARLAQTIDVATADAAVRVQTTEARHYLEDELFAKWANQVLAGGDGARELDRARVMAEAMLRVAGDALYRDTIATIDRTDADGVTHIARAFKAYSAAATLIANDRFDEATTHMAAAHTQLAESPVRHLAALSLGTIGYIRGEYAELERVLGDIDEASTYAYARGRANWILGMAAFARGRMADTQVFYDESLAIFERMGDVEQAASVHNLLSGLAYQMGDTVTEWRHRRAALDALTVSRSPRFRYNTLLPTAISARTESPEAALAIQESLLALARESGRQAAVVETLAHRASTLISLGRTNEASESASEARAELNRMPDPAFRSLLELPVLAVESDLARGSNPRAAVESIDQAIQTATARGDRARLPMLHLRLAKANVARGWFAEADRALSSGIKTFDELRASPAGSSGISAFDESWQLFETAVQLAIRQGDLDRAFVMSERGRSHFLPSNLQQKRGMPTLAEVQQLVRPHEALIALNQFDDELAVWVIRRERADVIRRPLRRADARRIVARQADEIQRASDRPTASTALFDAFVRPLSSRLAGVTRIVFVPDATYQDVSFPALWDRTEGRFLVERLTISAAPSVTVLAASSLANRPAAPSSTSILVMASDAGADAAQAVAKQYKAAEVAIGRDATRTRLLSGTNSVVHLVAPTYRNAAFPSLSHLVLTDDPGRRYSGAVLGHEIADRSMVVTRVVVLEEVASQQGYRAAGTFDLATAFLTAGVPAVLGTLPGAKAPATRELIVGFHREMAGQASAEDALTRVQRNALQQNGGRLGAWTALVIYGSDR